jgi:hypothetical protein
MASVAAGAAELQAEGICNRFPMVAGPGRRAVPTHRDYVVFRALDARGRELKELVLPDGQRAPVNHEAGGWVARGLDLGRVPADGLVAARVLFSNDDEARVDISVMTVC